jgi:hypothetical protein
MHRRDTERVGVYGAATGVGARSVSCAGRGRTGGGGRLRCALPSAAGAALCRAPGAPAAPLTAGYVRYAATAAYSVDSYLYCALLSAAGVAPRQASRRTTYCRVRTLRHHCRLQRRQLPVLRSTICCCAAPRPPQYRLQGTYDSYLCALYYLLLSMRCVERLATPSADRFVYLRRPPLPPGLFTGVEKLSRLETINNINAPREARGDKFLATHI